MVPQPDGDSSKVKVKVRVNIHGIFSVSGASLIEKQKGEGEDMQTDTEPVVQNESRAEEQVGLLLPQSLLWCHRCQLVGFFVPFRVKAQQLLDRMGTIHIKFMFLIVYQWISAT